MSFQNPHHLRKILLLCCVGLILIIGGWMIVDYGKWRTVYQKMASAVSSGTFSSDKNEALSEELAELRKQVTVLERAAQVDKVEQSEVKQQLSKLQTENFDLREELGFYKNIMPEVSQGKGLKISGLRLEKLNEKQRYQLVLILTRIVKGGTVADGSISITIHGHEKETDKDYNIKELLAEKDKELSFKIKHFERVSYRFVLPESFKPVSITVMLKQNGSKSKEKRMTYLWDEIQA